MKINITCCLFVIDNIKSEYVKKNDEKVLKVLVTKKDHKIFRIEFDNKTDIKTLLKQELSKVINTNKFHTEQVYTFGDSKFFSDNAIDIIYIAVAKINDIKKLPEDYEFIPFVASTKKNIALGEQEYSYDLIQVEENNKVKFYHNIKNISLAEEKNILEILTAYKYLKSRIANTSIIFNLLPEVFTLEDVRQTYELIREETVDKSNFRKKYAKYCKKIDIKVADKGYRPPQLYTFNPEASKVFYR